MESRGPSLVRRGMIAAALLAAVAAPTVLLAQAAAPAPPKLEDVAKAVADNGAALNMVWTLVAGFLVMFMQLGFAMVETGFTRAKNAGHTVTMNFMVYAIGMLAYWVIGFAIHMGGVGALGTLGGYDGLNSMFSITIGGHEWGLFGMKGFFLTGVAYNASVFAFFLFQMVFMDTTLTIPTGALAERWKFSSFCVFTVFLGAIIYPVFGNWAWGGGWLSALGRNVGLGNGYVDFAGSGVVHLTGGVIALVTCKLLGPRRGKFNADGIGKRDPRPQHPDGDLRHLRARLRLVRLQRRLDARRHRRPHRRRRDEHDARRRRRRDLGDGVCVDEVREARSVDAGERHARRSRRDHRAVRLRHRALGRRHRPDRRRAGLLGGRVLREEPQAR